MIDRFELYNIKEDIGERTDLSGKEPEHFDRMLGELKKKYRDVRDESPMWPAWTWPRVEGKRIREFYEAEKAASKNKTK